MSAIWSRPDNLVIGPACIFISIPKCGVTAIKQAVIEAQGRTIAPHDRNAFQRIDAAEVIRRRAGGAFVFTIVRHPVQRFLSCWRHKIRDGHMVTTKGLRAYGDDLRPGMGIKEFARFVHRTPDARSDNHFRSQVSFLFHEGTLLPGFIGRLETIATDWPVIRAGIGDRRLTERLPAANATEAAGESVGPDIAKLIESRYALDFQRLGYVT